MKTVEIQRVSKSFSGVKALQNVSFTIRGGEIHALCGENGAGKSTIIKILAGHYTPDEGGIVIDGQPVQLTSPRKSKQHGIAVIHQELLLVPQLTVAENISLGQWPTLSNKLVDWNQMKNRAHQALSLLGSDIDPLKKVQDLSTGEQQLVEIARSLSQEAKMLILDEPTASLSEAEARKLMGIVRGLRDKGLAIVYVSHRMDEVFELSDQVTVLRDGRLVGSFPRKEVNSESVVRMMVGREVSLERKSKSEAGAKVLELKGLTRQGVIEDISFSLHEGEILGLAGLVGSGRTEIARCLFGLDAIDSGQILMDGTPAHIRNPQGAMKLGIGFVPEDRKSQGLILGGSVRDNVVMSILGKISRAGWINREEEEQLVEDYKSSLNIKTPTIDQTVGSLSGGNQQKVVLARWLATKPRVLLLDEPTRGVDVGARAEIQAIIEQLVSEGLAILIISSDLQELLTLSDRVIVIREGRNIAELQGEKMTKEEVLKYATGTDSR